MTYAEKRNYDVLNVRQAKEISQEYVKEMELQNVLSFGLPEIDDRYHVWRVPLINPSGERIGEIVIDAILSKEGAQYNPILLSKGKKAVLVLESLPITKQDIKRIKDWLDLFADSLTGEESPIEAE